MAGKPTGLASTDIFVSFSGSKEAVTGALTSASFNRLTAWSMFFRPTPRLVLVGELAQGLFLGSVVSDEPLTVVCHPQKAAYF